MTDKDQGEASAQTLFDELTKDKAVDAIKKTVDSMRDQHQPEKVIF